jgi:hypothetical protein
LTFISQYPRLPPLSAPHPAPDAPEPAVDAAIARAEIRLAKLARLSDKALAMAEAVKEDGSAESAQAFAKVSRAVRLTITLEAKLDDALAARRAGRAAEAERRRAEAAKDPYAPLNSGKKARVRELVREVIDRETPDPEESDTLLDALEERLLCDEAYEDIENLPVRDVVERLCADLELKPKWYRWDGEGWKPDPPFHRPLCSAFRTPSRRRVLADIPAPDPLE